MIRNMIWMSWIFLVGLAAAQAHEHGAHEHGAHEHGVARLDVAVEGNTVQLDLDSPAVNLLGFEHEPANAKERATLERAAADLKQADRLLAFTPAAGCTQKKAMVKSGLIRRDEAVHGHETGAGPDQAHEGEHADVAVFWEISCARPNALHEIDFRNLFQRFPGLQRLRVQAALPGGQTAAELTAAASKLKMR